jgi:hypothetical protein
MLATQPRHDGPPGGLFDERAAPIRERHKPPRGGL